MGFFDLGKKGNAVKGEKALNEGLEAYEAGDYKRALKLYEEAAEQGSADAQFFCGVMNYNGDGTTANKAKAKAYLIEVAAQTEYSELQDKAQYFLSKM